MLLGSETALSPLERMADVQQHGDAIARALQLVSADNGYSLETWRQLERQLVYDVILDGLDERVLRLFDSIRFFTGNAVIIRSFSESVPWTKALSLIIQHGIRAMDERPLEERYPRNSFVAQAAKRIRQRRFNITAANGNLQADEAEAERLWGYIAAQYAARRTRSMVDFLLVKAGSFWQSALDRYVFPRTLGTTILKTQPTFPWNYAVQLAARSWATTLTLPTSGQLLSSDDLFQVTADFVALFDLEPYIVWEIATALPAQYLERLGSLAQFQGSIDFQQRPPATLGGLLSDLFSWLPGTDVEERLQFSLEELLLFAAAFARECLTHLPGPVVFSRSLIEHKISTLIDRSRLDAIWSILVHDRGSVNVDFKSPGDWLKATLPTKPFVERGKGAVEVVDSALATESFLIATLKAVSVTDVVANTKCGVGFERYVVRRISVSGHPVTSGFYGSPRDRSEIDAIFETHDAIVIVECKKRMLSPATIGGSRDRLVQELTTTVAKGHEQLLRAQRHLLTNGQIRVNDRVIAFNGRSIFRVVVSLHDWGVFHDQAVVNYMLSSLLHLNFGHDLVNDAKVQEWIDEANAVTADLREHIAAIAQLNANFGKLPFHGAFFLPIDVLDLMLRRSGDVNALVKQLQMQASIITGNLEPYLDYLRFKA